MKRILIVCIAAALSITLLSGRNQDNSGSQKQPDKTNTSQDSTMDNQNSEKENKNTYENIIPEEAKRRLDGNENIVLLDVRTKQEYDQIHIPGSMLIPLDTLEATAESKITDKDTPVFIYCRSGNRSITASEILLDLGYSNVYNLGGIKDWPYETEASSG